MLRRLQAVRMLLLLWVTQASPNSAPAPMDSTHGVATGIFSWSKLRRRVKGSLQFQRGVCMRTLQVAEVRETQPDCRLYIAITKCDQLEETPSVAEQDTGELDSSNSSNGGGRSDTDLALLKHTAMPDLSHVLFHLSHGPA